VSFINSLYVKLFSRKVGQDQFGNSYYLGKDKDYLGNNKRYVLYKGRDEASKVPPLWHAWLHYLSDELPPEDKDTNFSWQKAHLPNLTGTKYAYDPAKAENKLIEVYKRWDPK
jgi:NADH:ubiquinone oxidoreductase subunit